MNYQPTLAGDTLREVVVPVFVILYGISLYNTTIKTRRYVMNDLSNNKNGANGHDDSLAEDIFKRVSETLNSDEGYLQTLETIKADPNLSTDEKIVRINNAEDRRTKDRRINMGVSTVCVVASLTAVFLFTPAGQGLVTKFTDRA